MKDSDEAEASKPEAPTPLRLEPFNRGVILPMSQAKKALMAAEDARSVGSLDSVVDWFFEYLIPGLKAVVPTAWIADDALLAEDEFIVGQPEDGNGFFTVKIPKIQEKDG